MVETTYYIGAYLQVRVSKTVAQKSRWVICSKKHKNFGSDKFCGECGGEMVRGDDAYRYPTMIADLVEDGDLWADELEDITPEYLYNSGVMIFESGQPIIGEWLKIASGDDMVKINPLPSDEEVEGLEVEFKNTHKGVIDEIEKSKHVIDVCVKFGLVTHYGY